MRAVSRTLLVALLAVAFTGCGDEPPVFVETDLIPSTDDPSGPYDVRAIVVDDRGVVEVSLRVAGAAGGFTSLRMRHEGDNVWRGRLPVLPRSTTVRYYLVARDVLDQESREPSEAPQRVFAFRMTASATDDDGRPPLAPVDRPPGPDGPSPGEAESCAVEITYPRFGDTLDPREDDFAPAVQGLQTPVTAATDAPDGSSATLVVSGVGNVEATAAGGLVEIEEVTLPVGEVTLELRISGDVSCSAKSSVGVLDAGGEPECLDDASCGGEGAVCFRGNCIGLIACATLDDCPAGMLCHEQTCIRPQELPADACDEDDDCLPGLVCAFDMCSPETCRDSDDCLADERCFLGECVTEDLPAPETCGVDEDCSEGEQCLAGLCIQRSCVTDDDCPEDRGNCFNGFCLGFRPPVGACESDEDCPGNQQCFLNEVCLPGFLPLPEACRDADDCPGGADDNVCLFGACIEADCQEKADCDGGQDCRFGFCVPEDLPLPVPGACGPGQPECPDGSTCIFSICVPDAVPIPRPCNPDGTCASERQQCLFGIFCFGF